MSTEVRDKLAALEGWTKPDSADNYWSRCGPSPCLRHHSDHPIPDDLTACAKAWDDHAGKHGWFWWRTCFEWLAQSGGPFIRARESGTDAASELRDRWELLGLVLKARGVV